MLLKLKRGSEKAKSTPGTLSTEDRSAQWRTLEDAWHVGKIKGETRIPAGLYEVTLQTAGTLHGKYAARFPDMHAGMLTLQKVAGFAGVMIHIGNDIDDTEGCILIGSELAESADPDKPYTLHGSEKAYREFYPMVRDALKAKDKVWIQVIDP